MKKMLSILLAVMMIATLALTGCGLRAPHGGIFVLPVISHPFGFLAAVILGALVGMLLLGVLRKRIEPSES